LSETARISDQLRRTYEADTWYGPPLRQLLADLTAAEAAARPVAAAHTIWEIVLHLSAWMDEVRQRLLSGRSGMPADGDWPAVAGGDEAAWAAARRRLDERHQALLRDVAALDETRLAESIVNLGDDGAPAGSVSFYVLVHGSAQHNAYHAGQIALLKRALRGAARQGLSRRRSRAAAAP
jgi:uncharacterized damage-inducible protein DinB